MWTSNDQGWRVGSLIKRRHLILQPSRDTVAPCCSTDLGEGGGRHLYSAFIGGVNLQVVSVGAVQPQQPAAREARIVTWGEAVTL